MAIYSTNPKMDTSGIKAEQPVYGYMGNKIGTREKTGGDLYMEAVKEQSDEYGMNKTKALTSDANLRAAARYVNQGMSCDHAVDIVSRDTMWMPDKVDIVKAGAKAVKKMSKGSKGY
jgi:hypothetical protein